MPKARNMIIDGYKKGIQLQKDQYGIFYIFNGRNPLGKEDFTSYQILTEESNKDTVSTVGRGLIGSALFGHAGISASLTGKENRIYTIKVNWDKDVYKDSEPSILELDSDFYKTFMLKCTRTEEDQKEFEEIKRMLHPERYGVQPPKYIYDYTKWLKHNNLKDERPKINDIYWNALDDNPDTNPILDCCRMINPKYEEFMKKQQSKSEPENNDNNKNNTDIKSKLKELKSMFEEDLITEEEYNNKKQELLSKM